MSFIRAKFINGAYYYYLVESERVGGRVIQRTKQYLGKREEAEEYAGRHGVAIIEPVSRPLVREETLDEIIAKKLKEFCSAKIPLELNKQLRDEVLTVWTYESTTIEGSTLSRREVDFFIHEGRVSSNKPFEHYLDVRGHKDAVELVYYWVDDSRTRPVQELDLLNLHKHVMYGRTDGVGKYRQFQVYIRNSSHTPPPPSQVPQLMRELIKRVNNNPDRLPPVVHAAVTHADFESIHPFIDGNGRVGRLLANWMLMRQGYPPLFIQARERKRYFSYLESVHTKNDYSKLAWFFKRKMNASLDFHLKRTSKN